MIPASRCIDHFRETGSFRPASLCSHTPTNRTPRIMRWPWSPQNPNQPFNEEEEAKRRKVEWSNSLTRTDWSHYLEPRNLIHPIAFAATALLLVDVYKRFLRRVPSAQYIKPQWFRKRSVFGTVVRVGDGDNFRLFHTPGGRLTGWGWLPWKRIPSSSKGLTANTVCIWKVIGRLKN